MSTEPTAFERLIASVVDGALVDWAQVLQRARSEDERRIIEQMRVLASIAGTTGPDYGPMLVSDRETLNPSRWGALEIIEEIGRGHFGRVFRARETRLDREVALKVLDRRSGEASDFVHEAHLLSRVRHPNVVTVYGADVVGDQVGIWMELIRGRTVDAILRDQGTFGPREAALICADLCMALAAVHAAGLTHRDVKAQNVMRETHGRFVLMDFGAGSAPGIVSEHTHVTGTPLYMAPELFAGLEASAATDLYALGVLLFLMVSGEFPVVGQTVAELRQAHAGDARRLIRELRPDVTESLAHVIDLATAKDPRARFRSAAEMARALAATLDVSARPHEDSPGEIGPWRWLRRPLPLWAVALLIVSSVALTTPLRSMLIGAGTAAPMADPSVTPGVIGRLSAERWDVLTGYLELAGSLAERGDWSTAAEQYEKTSALMGNAGLEDEPQRAHVRGSLGWALLKARRFADAKRNLDLAVYMLSQEGGDDHPLLATFEMGRAYERHAVGDVDGAAEALMRAIDIRRRALAATASASTTTTALNREALLAALQQGSPEMDADDDWLPDAIEVAVGLNPTAADSDGNGTSDPDEDSNGDGVSNALEWAIVPDPARVLVHFGRVDPERMGFRRERLFSGAETPGAASIGPAWTVEANPMGFYFRRLTSAQKRAATTRGFRMLSRGSLQSGLAYVDIDLAPSGPRFDQNFVALENRLHLLLLTNVSPREGEELDIAPVGAWPMTEFVFNPATGNASVSLDGHRVGQPYPGHRQYQEDFGLFWGASNDVGNSPVGIAEFSLILFQIR